MSEELEGVERIPVQAVKYRSDAQNHIEPIRDPRKHEHHVEWNVGMQSKNVCAVLMSDIK
jgi:hypothetical protein